MKLYRLTRILKAEKASQKEAEHILGRKIHNLLYGSDGFIIEENGQRDWMPASVFGPQAALIDKPINYYQYLINESQKSIRYLKEQANKSEFDVKKRKLRLAAKRLETLIKDLTTLIDYEITEL